MATSGRYQWLSISITLVLVLVLMTVNVDADSKDLKHIGELPKAVLEMKHMLSHGPVFTSPEELQDDSMSCPESYVLVNNGTGNEENDETEGDACKQCPIGYFKSTERKCSACQDSMISLFGATDEDQCFEPRPNIPLLTKEIKAVDKSFAKKPCGIISYLRDMIKNCNNSQGIESQICKYVLSPWYDQAVNEYMGGNENRWCNKNYFMKNVTEEFEENLCSSVKNLRSQLKSCDTGDDLCNDLNEVMSDFDFDFDVCKEKDFVFYVLERILVMENPCELHKMLPSMKTASMAKRSVLAKPIFKEISSIVNDEGMKNFTKDWMDTSDFWSVDMCSETDKLKSFLYDDIWNDMCNALQNLGTYNTSCKRTKFKKANKIVCKIMETISENEIPKYFEEGFHFDLYSINPCDEGERALDHLKSVVEKPCTFLESFKDFADCSKSSLYCTMMDGLRSEFEDSDNNTLSESLEEWFGISITDINPCEMAEFVDDLWNEIGNNPCNMFNIIEKKSKCTSKKAPCKFFKSVVGFLTDSDLPSEFENSFGLKLWQMNPCEEWGQLKELLLALINRPCSVFSLLKSQYKKQCPKTVNSVFCTGFSMVNSAISDSSEMQDFISSISICEEQDYLVGIFQKVSNGISRGSCIGYKELLGYVKDCPTSNPMVCSPLGDLIDCLGKAPADDKNNNEDEGGFGLNEICSTVHQVREYAANIDSQAKEVCDGLAPELCSIVSRFFSNDITSCTLKNMISELGKFISSDKTGKQIRMLIDSLLESDSFLSAYNRGGMGKTSWGYELTEVFDVLSFEALAFPTLVDVLSSRIAGKYYDNMIYPMIDTVLGPIKDDLLSMFSSFDDVSEAAMEKVWSAIDPVMEMTNDLGVERLIGSFEKFMDGMIEHYFVNNKNTKKLMTDIAYILQIEPRDIYRMSKTSLEEYLTQLFKNAPDETKMMKFYQGLSYGDWADHKLITSGIRKFATEFTKYLVVMENRALERGFVSLKKAETLIDDGKVTFKIYGDVDEGKSKNGRQDLLIVAGQRSATKGQGKSKDQGKTKNKNKESSNTENMDWFYLTAAPIDYDNDAWKDVEDGKIDVSKYEDRFKYGEKDTNNEMMKNIPEFEKEGVPILKMAYGKYYGEIMFWMKRDILETMEMVYPECNMIKKVLDRVEECRMYQTSIICYPLLMFDQHVLNLIREHCGPVCMEAIQTIANPCEIPLDVTSAELYGKNKMTLRVKGKVYHWMELSWEKIIQTGRGYVMRVFDCPINWLDSYLKNDLNSLMQIFEKVAPAAGFPEVYTLLQTHHMDRKITELVSMGLQLLESTGLTCNVNDRGMQRIRYEMEKCDAGKYMSSDGCKACPGVSYSAKGAYGVDQCDRTNQKMITCRPVKIRAGSGTLECSSDKPISCTYTCPEDTFFSIDDTMYSKFNFSCDESTNKWSHEDVKNEFGRVPNCAEIELPSPKLNVAVKFDASECPTDDQLSEGINNYFTAVEDNSYDCFSADESACSLLKVTCEAAQSVIEVKMIVKQESTSDSTELENVKTKLVDDATAQTLTLTYSTDSSKRKKRDTQELNSNGEVEAEDVALDCDPGYEAIDSQCLACAAGTYDNNGTCTECPQFTYNDLDAATECASCPDGYYTFGGGQDSLADCIAPCSEGWYRDEETMSCVSCPEGTSSPYNSSSVTSCDGCPVGQYFYNETAQCENCPLASYNGKTGATSCTSCSTGWFTNGDGKTSSSDCLEPCLPGKFMNLTAEKCQDCPEGMESLPNATSSYGCDLTAEDFVLVLEENADEMEELAEEGGLDIAKIENVVQEIEKEIEEEENSGHSVLHCGNKCSHWLNLLVLKLCMMMI